MRMFVPGDRMNCTPHWWNSERYDYCEIAPIKDDTDNLFNKVIMKISRLFA